MSICESEENRKKLAWLVPGYILLAWFLCVLFSSSMNFDYSRQANSLTSTNYDIVYLDEDDLAGRSVCQKNGTVITLNRGAQSAVIIRLGRHNYHYRPFNCTIQIEAGPSLDGISAVVELMDLREHEDDYRQPGGHWGSSVCVDYVEAYTDKSQVRNKLCGEWDVSTTERLNSHGPKQTLVGYCYDDRSGHSCESKSITLKTVIDARGDLAGKFGLNLRRSKGFSIVVTGYRHANNTDRHCEPDEFECRINDFSIHSAKPHCIWDRLKCDTHQNCGFTLNRDESECPVNGIAHWSISTMTLLIVIYLSIVLILVVITMLLLKWHKSLRAPMEMITEAQARRHNGDISGASMITTGLPDGSTATEARSGTVSIMVMYRPPKPNGDGDQDVLEPPPSYESIFLGDNPPNYNMLRVDIPSNGEVTTSHNELPLRENHQANPLVIQSGSGYEPINGSDLSPTATRSHSPAQSSMQTHCSANGANITNGDHSIRLAQFDSPKSTPTVGAIPSCSEDSNTESILK